MKEFPDYIYGILLWAIVASSLIPHGLFIAILAKTASAAMPMEGSHTPAERESDKVFFGFKYMPIVNFTWLSKALPVAIKRILSSEPGEGNEFTPANPDIVRYAAFTLALADSLMSIYIAYMPYLDKFHGLKLWFVPLIIFVLARIIISRRCKFIGNYFELYSGCHYTILIMSLLLPAYLVFNYIVGYNYAHSLSFMPLLIYLGIDLYFVRRIESMEISRLIKR
jgi:hypothetical protein